MKGRKKEEQNNGPVPLPVPPVLIVREKTEDSQRLDPENGGGCGRDRMSHRQEGLVTIGLALAANAKQAPS